MSNRITPEALWQAHRALAGGRSTVSGAELPRTLDECAKGPRETHYGLAVFIALVRHGNTAGIPVPPLVHPIREEELYKAARDLARPFLQAAESKVEAPAKKADLTISVDTSEARAGLAALQAQLAEVEAQTDRVLAKAAAARAGAMAATMATDC